MQNKPWFWRTSDAGRKSAGDPKTEAGISSGNLAGDRSTAPCNLLLSSEADEPSGQISSCQDICRKCLLNCHQSNRRELYSRGFPERYRRRPPDINREPLPAEAQELFQSLKLFREGVQNNKKRVDDILYNLTDSSHSLLGRLFLLITLLGIFIENSFLKSELTKAEETYKELKDNARTVLAASKETSIALKSKDIDNVEIAIANWNNIIGKIDSDLQMQFRTAYKQHIVR